MASFRFHERMLLVGRSAFLLVTVACGTKTSSPAECPVGSETCACDENRTCDHGLSCLSGLCVNPGATGGSAGSAGATGGGGAGEGGAGTGGASATGGASGGSSGQGGSSCGNTSTDPSNCGFCGHVCEADPQDCPGLDCCTNSTCAALLGRCIDETTNFVNCDDYCANIGESCVFECGGAASLEYSDYTDACETKGYAESSSSLCSGPLPWTYGTPRKVRCCCSDTH